MFALDVIDDATDDMYFQITCLLDQEGVEEDEREQMRPLLRWILENEVGRSDLFNEVVTYVIFYCYGEMNNWANFVTQDNLTEFFDHILVENMLHDASDLDSQKFVRGHSFKSNFQTFLAESFISIYG